MEGVRKPWWPTSDELVFLNHAQDPEGPLVANEVVVCDDTGHANEKSVCILRKEWKCHYPGCESDISDHEVNKRLQEYIRSVLNRRELTTVKYDAAELELKWADKIARMKVLMKAGQFIAKSTRDAPPENELLVRRTLRNEARRQRAQYCRTLQQRTLVALAISLMIIFYFEILLPWFMSGGPQDPFLGEDTCPS